MEQIRPIYDHIVVASEKRYNDTIKSESGKLELWFDPMFKPTQNAIICATCVGTPWELKNWQNEGIEPIVKLGDKVYFHYNSLTDSNVIPGYPGMYALMYDSIFCVVRDGNIVMVGDWTLIEKIYADDVELIDEVHEANGRMVPVKTAVRKKFGIIVETNVGHIPACGKIAHIGRGRTTENELDVEVGDIVMFHPHAEFENEIEGKKYFCVRQPDIFTKSQS